jgi:hypothetical protein
MMHIKICFLTIERDVEKIAVISLVGAGSNECVCGIMFEM